MGRALVAFAVFLCAAFASAAPCAYTFNTPGGKQVVDLSPLMRNSSEYVATPRPGRGRICGAVTHSTL